jgi:hypothetical protein
LVNEIYVDMHIVWKAFVNMVMNLLVSENAVKFLINCTTGSFSRRAQLSVLN